MIYRNALSHDAGLLHPPRPAKLLHVPAEVTLSAFVPEAGFTLPAAGPPAPGSRRASAGRHLDGRCGRPNLGLWPVGHPLLKPGSEELQVDFYAPELVTGAVIGMLFTVHILPRGSCYLVENKLGSS